MSTAEETTPGRVISFAPTLRSYVVESGILHKTCLHLRVMPKTPQAVESEKENLGLNQPSRIITRLRAGVQLMTGWLEGEMWTELRTVYVNIVV